MFQNLEQIRAKNASGWIGHIGGGENGGENIAKKIPSLIIDNGLIATLAFAIEKRGGYSDVMKAIITHLKDKNVNLYSGQDDLQKFLDFLTNSDSDVLRKVTAESMAFLNYLRRLA